MSLSLELYRSVPRYVAARAVGDDPGTAGAATRVRVEEDVVHRFLLTTAETLVAGALIAVAGVALGVLLYRVRLIRAAPDKRRPNNSCC